MNLSRATVSQSLLLIKLMVVALLLSVTGQTHAMKAPKMKPPEEVVRNTVDVMVSELRTNHDAYKSDPKKLYQMLEETLLPALHVPRMTSLILGKKHARAASPAQKAEFAEVFKNFILVTYADGLLNATGNEKVIYKEPVVLKPGRVKIQAELVTANGEAFPIDLYMSNTKDTRWRAYNIDVAGVNFIRTYSDTFKATLESKGIDGLIADLKAKTS